MHNFDSETFSTYVETESQDFAKSEISFTADMNSINKGNTGRDNHLNWNAALETGGVLVGGEVKVLAEIQLVRA